MDPILSATAVSKAYPGPTGPVPVLHSVSFALHAGDTVALTAPSGAGKSTLLHIAGLLDTPTSGALAFQGRNTATITERERTRLRGQRIGFVYQFHHLLPELTARENAFLPLWAAGTYTRDSVAHVDALFEQLGIAHRAHHRPAALSGGERQRVAVARALATKPALILADEPTGSLDVESGLSVFAALVEAAKSTRSAVLLATHNPDIAALTHHRWTLTGGHLHTQEIP